MSAKRVAYDMYFKREVLNWIYAEEDNPKTSYAAAQKFKVKKQTIAGWMTHKEEILNDDHIKKKRRLGGGRKTVLSNEAEGNLCSIITMERAEGNRVSGSDVKRWALALSKDYNIEDFKASDGWLEKFLMRNGYSFRRVTNLTSHSADVIVTRAVSYMTYLQSKIPDINRQKCILMDETAVYFEDPRRVTINESGKRHVILHSTGFASMRITAILSTTATGVKLPPVIIWKSSKPNDVAEHVHGCLVVQNEKAWVNQILIKNWIDLVFPIVDMSAGKALVWDSCKAHTAKSVKEHLQRRGIHNVTIPGGLTPYVQSGDLGIFKCFKDCISPIIASWKASDAVQRTARGNPKPPTKETVCQWVIQAWRDVPEAVMTNSIIAAGFGNHEDWMISKHDVYGQSFRAQWQNRHLYAPDENNEQNNQVQFEGDEDMVIDDN